VLGKDAPSRREDERLDRVAEASRRSRGIGRAAVGTVLAANAVAIVWLWLYDGGVTGIHDVAGVLTSIGRITGLLGAYFLLIQILLLARIRPIERLVGFDRLTVWHRLNGILCFYLILAHIVFITLGYGLTDRLSIIDEFTTMVGTYPGMQAALIGSALIVAVVVTSLVIVRRRLRYEAWYLVHLMAYLGVLLAWFHQVPTGNEFVLNAAAATYWTVLYVATLALLILFRLAIPIIYGFRHQMRVAEVVTEGPNVVSLRMTGRHLDRMGARAGQFFLWRFMTPRLVWQSHPFSLSAAPDGQSLRITVKNLGDFTSRIGEIPPGTRVVGVGPFGLFTDAVRQRDRVALIAGGVGITPIRSLIEEMPGDLVLLYRVMDEGDVVFRDELDELARDRGIVVHYVMGSHRDPKNQQLLSATHLRTLVPDIAERDVYVCGPPALTSLVENNLRVAGVPSKYIHSESFAFSPGPQPSAGGPGRSTRTRRTMWALLLAVGAALAAGLAWLLTSATTSASRTTLASTSKPSPAPVAQPTAAPAALPTATVTTPSKPKVTPTPKVANGQYAGSIVTEQYGAVQATIVTTNGKITNVLITAPQDNPRSAGINAQAVPILKSETLQAQSASINGVSGATVTSNAYVQSLQAALAKAHL
jgi:predicted ferric reductase/uncharacterized protein with FMN-binding domain